MRALIRAACVFALLVLAQRVRADDCTVRGSARVGLRPELAEPGLAREVTRQLGAALAARAIALCSPEVAALLAEITVRDAGPDAVAVTVRDLVTDKRVERGLALGHVPRDSRALAIAIAADELLRASWAELVLRDAPAPPSPPPEVVTRSLVDPGGPHVRTRARAFELGVEAAGARSRRRIALGPRLRVLAFFYERWALHGALEAGLGAREPGPHGDVRAHRYALELGAAWSFTPREARVGALIELGVSAARVHFEAAASRSGVARSFDDTSAAGHLRIRGFVGGPGPLRGTLTLGGSYTLRPVAARDAGQPVTELYGFGLELALGVAAFL